MPPLNAAKFPVLFPVSKEFAGRTVPHEIAPSASKSLLSANNVTFVDLAAISAVSRPRPVAEKLCLGLVLASILALSSSFRSYLNEVQSIACGKCGIRIPSACIFYMEIVRKLVFSPADTLPAGFRPTGSKGYASEPSYKPRTRK